MYDADIYLRTEIVNKFKLKIAKHEENINDILKQEKEEKEVRTCCDTSHAVMAAVVTA